MRMRPAVSRITAATTCSISAGAAGSGAIVGVDADIIIGEVASPHGGCRASPTQAYADGDFLLRHAGRGLFFAVASNSPALLGDQQIVQVQPHLGDVEVVDAGPANSGEDSSPRSEERREGHAATVQWYLSYAY